MDSCFDVHWGSRQRHHGFRRDSNSGPRVGLDFAESPEGGGAVMIKGRVLSSAKEMVRTKSVVVRITVSPDEQFDLTLFQKLDGGMGLAKWSRTGEEVDRGPTEEGPTEEEVARGKEIAYAALKNTLERAAKLEFQGSLGL